MNLLTVMSFCPNGHLFLELADNQARYSYQVTDDTLQSIRLMSKTIRRLHCKRVNMRISVSFGIKLITSYDGTRSVKRVFSMNNYVCVDFITLTASLYFF